ncbi:MAG: D-beta-hydroxybutyrate dehydrogenase [Halobacteriovorax sp.]|nr:D-beta-hydroxybutyrate dehydrogenase [Halobacteriovorax sp.]
MSKIAIVTGATSGIGAAIACELVKHDFQVINFDLRLPSQDQVGVKSIECDVSQEESVTRAYAQVKNEYGPAAILVNNCGLQFMSPVEDFPKEKWDLLIGVLLTGTFLCSKAVFKDMKEAGFGRIINISSVHGKLASPYKAAYVAAKHGVLGLAKVMAVEGAEFGITVNTICPGFVDTPLMREQVKSQMQLNQLSEDEVLKSVFLKAQNVKKLTDPGQVAGMVSFLISDHASTITGEAYNISGGWGMGL